MQDNAASRPAADDFAMKTLIGDIGVRSEITEGERGTSPAIKPDRRRGGRFQERFVECHVERRSSWLRVVVDVQLAEHERRFENQSAISSRRRSTATRGSAAAVIGRPMTR